MPLRLGKVQWPNITALLGIYFDKKVNLSVPFLLVGSLQPSLGGSVIAHNSTLSELKERVNNDPFVSENVVSAEILEIEPKKSDERLSFLVG